MVDVSIVVAAGVLIGGVLILVAFHGRRRDIMATAEAAATTGSTPVIPTGEPDSAATLAATEAVGEAMIDAGYTGATVRRALEEIAAVNGLPASQVLVFPTALMVSARGEGQHRTGAITSGERRLLLSQVDELQRTVDAARKGLLDPDSTVRRVRSIRETPPPYGPVLRVLGYVLICAGLAVLLGSTWTGVALSAGLGVVVGTALLVAERIPRGFASLLTVGMAFLVALVVFLLLRAGWGPGILAALIAPLVVLLPGVLLTTAALELSTGQMISGAGRLAAGGWQLVLLASGIVTAGVIVGVPDFDFTENPELLGPWAPWVAVVVFGVGIAVHLCVPRRSILWMLVVLAMAYATQVVAAEFVGGVLSAFVGALLVVPVTALVARQPRGPAALVSFMPAFWLLVPGALGLIGVTDILYGDTSGLNSLVATISTMVAISLGVLAGSVVSNRMERPPL